MSSFPPFFSTPLRACLHDCLLWCGACPGRALSFSGQSSSTPQDLSQAPAQPCCVQVGEIVRLAPKARQTVLFSATMTEEVQRLATLSLRQPVRLAADEPSTAPVRLSQEVLRLKARLQPIHQSSTPSQQFAGCAPGPVGYCQ